MAQLLHCHCTVTKHVSTHMSAHMSTHIFMHIPRSRVGKTTALVRVLTHHGSSATYTPCQADVCLILTNEGTWIFGEFWPLSGVLPNDLSIECSMPGMLPNDRSIECPIQHGKSAWLMEPLPDGETLLPDGTAAETAIPSDFTSADQFLELPGMD